jgi:Flp pilus assembly pilin Flp
MMRRVKALMRAFRRRDEGVTMVEYALLSILVAMVVAIGAITLGEVISGTFGKASNCVNSPTNCGQLNGGNGGNNNGNNGNNGNNNNGNNGNNNNGNNGNNGNNNNGNNGNNNFNNGNNGNNNFNNGNNNNNNNNGFICGFIICF